MNLNEDAKTLVENGCRSLSRAPNMPTTLDATEFLANGAVFLLVKPQMLAELLLCNGNESKFNPHAVEF